MNWSKVLLLIAVDAMGQLVATGIMALISRGLQ
jgi:hypothetical protein